MINTKSDGAPKQSGGTSKGNTKPKRRINVIDSGPVNRK